MSSVIKSPRRVSMLSRTPVFLPFPALGAETEPEREPEDVVAEEPQGPTAEEIAAALLAEAEARAQAIVAAAEAEAEGMREAARQAGYAQGAAEAEAQWQARFAALETEAAALRAEYDAVCDAAEPELAQLSLDIARKILKQEIEQNAETVLPVVRAAVHRVRDKQVRVLVNPADLDIVRASRETFLGIVDGVAELDIVSDRRVGQGGCVLETPSGNLDARIETQLAVLAETIERGADEHENAA